MTLTRIKEPRFPIEEVIKAIQTAEGVVTVACRRMGMSRTTFYEYCKESKELRSAYDEAKKNTDMAIENELLGMAFDGRHKDQLGAIKYYTACKMGWRVTSGLDITSRDDKIEGFKVIFVGPSDPDDS